MVNYSLCMPRTRPYLAQSDIRCLWLQIHLNLVLLSSLSNGWSKHTMADQSQKRLPRICRWFDQQPSLWHRQHQCIFPVPVNQFMANLGYLSKSPFSWLEIVQSSCNQQKNNIIHTIIKSQWSSQSNDTQSSPYHQRLAQEHSAGLTPVALAKFASSAECSLGAPAGPPAGLIGSRRKSHGFDGLNSLLSWELSAFCLSQVGSRKNKWNFTLEILDRIWMDLLKRVYTSEEEQNGTMPGF